MLADSYVIAFAVHAPPVWARGGHVEAVYAIKTRVGDSYAATDTGRHLLLALDNLAHRLLRAIKPAHRADEARDNA
jgi:hypothetical protein